MRRLARQPLTWIVLCEVVVVAALVAVSWHVLVGGTTSAAPLILPATTTPEDTAAPQMPPGVLAPPKPSTRPLLPGLNVDAGFWRVRLVALNAAEAQLEALEWRIVHSAMETIQRYVDSVVVPAVKHAEGRGG